MFRNLRTSTKLLLLCGMFTVSVCIATYQLVTEKRLAIEFARKELVGTRFLAALREVYATLLTEGPAAASAARSQAFARAAGILERAETESGGQMGTAELSASLALALRDLSQADRGEAEGLRIAQALADAERLVVRVGDDSNLTLDPDLDSYYLQNAVVMKVPALLGYLGSLQAFRAGLSTASDEQAADLVVARSRLRTVGEEIEGNVVAAFRVTESAARQPIEAAFGKAISEGNAYLQAFDAREPATASEDEGSAERAYTGAVAGGIEAWAVAQAELERLLNQRIDKLAGGLRRSLMLIGALVGLSALIAIMTHRDIVRPLERLEGLARKVHTTMDYSLRSDYVSQDEIGKLATAFNEMLSELASAREREASNQAELARVARLTTMGAMTASIAHEINQPLAAIVTNSNAAMRWLKSATPDLGEVRAALTRIAGDGHRASQVIGGIRALFKHDGGATMPLALNDLILEVLALVDGELRRQGVSLQTELAENLPEISGNRVQLQQVIVNLVMNAVEAMQSVPAGARLLLVESDAAEAGRVKVTVEDSGPGIDPKSVDRIFEAFYTTKEQGTGMGLAICRTIVEAHGGRLRASAREPAGSAFSFVLPVAAAGKA